LVRFFGVLGVLVPVKVCVYSVLRLVGVLVMICEGVIGLLVIFGVVGRLLGVVSG